jgi:hypothetical protein
MSLPAALNDRAMTRLRVATAALFCAALAFYIWDTVRWPMIWDTPIMHYVRFLMSHGFKPYSDITDMNLPGCYLTEAWGMAIFGWSDLSWRVYEFFLMGVLTIAGMAIGGRRNWFTGVFAGTFFLVMHASEGPRVATERDELMAVLLVAAAALAMTAVRRKQAGWMLAVGLTAGLAVSLKPAALLMDLGLLLLVIWHKRRGGETMASMVWCMLAGNAVIAAVMFGFLASQHAFGPFWFIVTKIVPNYSKLVQPGATYLVRHVLPAAMVPLILLGLLAWTMQKKRIELEQAILLLGIAVGAISYFMQKKGLTYHRYMVVIFVLLWVGWQLAEAMRRERQASRWAAVAGVAVLFLAVVPYYVRLALRSPRDAQTLSPMSFQLQADLTHMGGQRGGQALDRQVLCLDVIDGCFDALYRMRLVQNTGATGDLLLFAKQRDFAVDYYRDWFLNRDHEHPANVVVLVNEWYQNNQVPSFNKLSAWPQYQQEIAEDYTPVVERRFGAGQGSPAYRIYLRKGSDVLAREHADPLR